MTFLISVVVTKVDVPGCVPYREYLYTYLREQPIWQSLRFWNAAFFDALQCERVHRPVPPSKPMVATARKMPEPNSMLLLDDKSTIDKKSKNVDSDDGDNADDDEDDEESNIEVLKEDQKYHQNISFGQLGFVYLVCLPLIFIK